MNLCDYYVKEVISTPRQVRHHYDGNVTEWWEVDVSYIYDNGKEVESSLFFDTREEVERVTKGYHFLK